jgi:zinc ribbon protein
MRFACQSCGKAYNLPEEKIADKSNVKLKCRVCGAIVEVKRQGDVVAQMLAEGDGGKRGRVSEAPAPLTALTADDGDDATHAIAVGDHILSESGSGDDAAAALLGHVTSALRGMAPLPPPSPTGFGVTPIPPPLAAPEAPAAVSPVFPPLRPEPAPSFARQDPPIAPPLPNIAGSNPGGSSSPNNGGGIASPGGSSASASSAGSPPPPPLPSLGHAEPPALNGSSGPSPRFADIVPLPEEPGLAVPSPLGGPAATLGELGGFGGMPSVEVQQGASAPDDTTRKMLAALATGILIGFIIARLFF